MSWNQQQPATGWEGIFFKTTKFFAVISAFITMLLMLYISADVFGRYAFNKPLPNSQAVAETLMVGLAFLGLAYVQAQKKNIYLDFFTNRLGPLSSALQDVFSNALSVLVVGLIVWASASWVWESLVIRDSMQGSFPIPYYYSKTPMFIGLVFLFLQFLIDLAKSIAQAGTAQDNRDRRGGIRMDPLTLGFIAFGLLLVIFMLGVQIGIGMAVVGFFGVLFMTGNLETSLGILRTTPFYSVANFNYTVMPLFILMGLFCSYGGIGGDAFRALRNTAMAKLPGGLAIATVWASCIFGAASGSAYAAAAVFTKIALPEMEKANYNTKFSCGCIASSSALAVLIPPSLMFLIYAIITEQSIAKLLISGVFPGLLFAALLSIAVIGMAKVNPSLAPPIVVPKLTLKEKLKSFSGLWSIFLLALIVLGGIYSGIFSATEAGAVGAFAAMLVAACYGRLTKSVLVRSMAETAETTCMLFFVLIGAEIFTTFLASSGFSDKLVLLVTGVDCSALGRRDGTDAHVHVPGLLHGRCRHDGPHPADRFPDHHETGAGSHLVRRADDHGRPDRLADAAFRHERLHRSGQCRR